MLSPVRGQSGESKFQFSSSIVLRTPKHSQDRPETPKQPQRQVQDKPETGPRQARGRPETLQTTSKTGPRQARDRPETSPRQARDPPNNLKTDPRRPKQSQDMSKTPQFSVLGSTAGLGADNSAFQAFKMCKIQSLSNELAARASDAGYGHGHRSMQDGSSKKQNVSMREG